MMWSLQKLGWCVFLGVTTVALASCNGEGAMGSANRDCVGDDCPSAPGCASEPCDAPHAGCAVDSDGDGFGEGCAQGPDCDDGDPVQTGKEVCDGRDNDCDGVVDNGTSTSCASCQRNCTSVRFGVGTERPFSVDGDHAIDVAQDDRGAVTLGQRTGSEGVIWIANSAEGTVSRFRTDAPHQETGRFLVGDSNDPAGPLPAARPRLTMDPSRTSVNLLGDVYVGNREWIAYAEDGSRRSRAPSPTMGSVVRISSRGARCPDTNGDGTITTSTDGRYLPWGQDDCVLWFTDLQPFGLTRIRSIAAQDIEGPTGDLQQFVWVGGYDSNLIAKLDGVTGEVLFVTESPVRPYGFAFDGSGNLWISTRASQEIGRVDTMRCVDEGSCSGAACTDDSCIKQRIAAPITPYGITVDFKQRVWIGGQNALRYDPSLPPASRWSQGYLSGSGPGGVGISVHGIAADAQGWIWGAQIARGVVRINADNPAQFATVGGTPGFGNKGIAIDGTGNVWSIAQDSALVITPGAGLNDATVETNVANTIVGAYTYSDMTGVQQRLVTRPRGTYQQVVERCTEGRWGDFRWVAETPDRTSIRFRIRTAASRDALGAARFIGLASTPPDAPPVSLSDALSEAGADDAPFLEIEATLLVNQLGAIASDTPRLVSFEVSSDGCP